MAFAFVRVGRFAADEERIVLSKLVVRFLLLMVCQEVSCTFVERGNDSFKF